VQAAASCYIELIVKESDNNVKLIVLDRLIALREAPAHEKILQVYLISDAVELMAQFIMSMSLELFVDVVFHISCHSCCCVSARL